jgi:hypothetical protein
MEREMRNEGQNGERNEERGKGWKEGSEGQHGKRRMRHDMGEVHFISVQYCVVEIGGRRDGCTISGAGWL